MARHRNVRQFGIDDISIYDESLASSVDDDYGISPNTADRYLYSADKRNMNSTIFFEREDQEPLKISEEEFPVRDDCNEEYSPGYITGRIKSDYVQKSSPLKGSHGAHDLDPQDLILGAMDDQVKPDIERKASPKNKNKGAPSTPLVNLPLASEPVQLAEALSQKLDLTAQSKNSSTPVRFATNNATASPSKPIDRKSLLVEYLERRKQSGNKDVINLIVVGHVDAGKSTLMGNLLYQLGHVSGKQLSKYRWEAQKLGKASFAYAWVLDQTTEERNRGVTMDIAQTSFETATKRIALMDAPGHKDFVPRVIGGASQADAALLVVNATNGEFETGFGHGGQTREHARLARLLGVSRLIVAVNKMDTVGWSQARFDEIQSQLSHFLKNMNIVGAVFCPVSGLTGVNLVCNANIKTDKSENLMDVPLFTWYTGPCLVDIIDSIPSPDRTIDGPFRFVVSDIFKPPGLSVPVVAGRVLSGGVSSGVNLATSKVLCQPSGLPAAVKSIRSLCTVRSGTETVETADSSGGLLDQVVKSAFAGDQVALVLSGIDPYQSLVPGDVITDPDNPVPLASRISAKILVFTVPQPITQGYPVIFYYHCTSVGAHVTKLKSMTHKENKLQKTVKKPRCLLGNCTAEVEIILERPVCVEVYERCKPLGRFMLRVNGESIAGGTVTAVLPPKKNRLAD